MHVCMHVSMYVYDLCMHVCMCVCNACMHAMHPCMHVFNVSCMRLCMYVMQCVYGGNVIHSCSHAFVDVMYVCTRRMHVSMDDAYVCACMFACLSACMHACMRVCM